MQVGYSWASLLPRVSSRTVSSSLGPSPFPHPKPYFRPPRGGESPGTQRGPPPGRPAAQWRMPPAPPAAAPAGCLVQRHPCTQCHSPVAKDYAKWAGTPFPDTVCTDVSSPVQLYAGNVSRTRDTRCRLDALALRCALLDAQIFLWDPGCNLDPSIQVVVPLCKGGGELESRVDSRDRGWFVVIQKGPLRGSLLEGSDAVQRHASDQLRRTGGHGQHEAQRRHIACQLADPV